MSEIKSFPTHLTRAAKEDGEFSLAPYGLSAVLDALDTIDGDGNIDFKHPHVIASIRASRMQRQLEPSHPAESTEATERLFNEAAQTASISIFPATDI